MIERIRQEHGYIMRLLAILRSKHHALENEKPINYELMREIVDYLGSHSESSHHPKEDLLYQYYIETYGQRQDFVDLEEAHKQLSKKTHHFLEMIEMILRDAIVPQDLFIEQLADFIVSQKQHLDMEEALFIPVISQTFTPKDWLVVESRWLVEEDDPVFGDTIADRYKQLAQRVRQHKEAHKEEQPG